jgi:hypothetical protein
MVVKHNTIDNTYLVYDEEERWLILEVSENHKRGCLEVTHYGREEVAVQTIFSPQFNLEVEIEKPEDKDFERVVIRTGYDTVSWEHCDDPIIVQ